MEQQLLITYCYLQDNPDEFYDLVMIEGRAIEGNMSIPVPSHDDLPTDRFMNEVLYRRWLTDVDVKLQEKIDFVRTDARSVLEDYPQYAHYVADYMHSVLHGIHTWSVNLALINMLQTRSKVIKWFSFSTSEKYNSSKENKLKELEIGRDLLGKYLLTPAHWPVIRFHEEDGFDNTVYCKCKHLNEEGHKLFWEKHIKPYLSEYL